MTQYKTHKWAVKIADIVMSTLLLIFLLWFGVEHNMFNWGSDWWYSALTLIVLISGGYIPNWFDKED